jgi:large subunit ribosomal protein L7/L12
MKEDKIYCEKCGAEMKPINKGIGYGMTCPNCGWGWTTSYFEPILLDDTNYHVILVSNNCSVSIIKIVSEISGYNYIEAKRMIESAPVTVFSGKAVDIKPVKEKLEKASVDFNIEPEFTY